MPDGAQKPDQNAERTSQVATPRTRLTVDAPSPPSVFLDVPNMPWESTKFPGIKSKTLYSDGTGMATLLLEMEPGAEVPLHEHTAIEQTYVLTGHFVDEEGECLPGQFVWRPEGNTHVAWAGKEGATVLGIFLKPNIFADGRPFFTQTPKD